MAPESAAAQPGRGHPLLEDLRAQIGQMETSPAHALIYRVDLSPTAGRDTQEIRWAIADMASREFPTAAFITIQHAHRSDELRSWRTPPITDPWSAAIVRWQLKDFVKYADETSRKAYAESDVYHGDKWRSLGEMAQSAIDTIDAAERGQDLVVNAAVITFISAQSKEPGGGIGILGAFGAALRSLEYLAKTKGALTIQPAFQIVLGGLRKQLDAPQRTALKAAMPATVDPEAIAWAMIEVAARLGVGSGHERASL